MSKEYNYNGYIIKNVPYSKSEPRWFITNKDGSKNDLFKYPQSTLREAKEYLDLVLKNHNKI